MDNATEDHWRELSEQILTDIKEWRKGHPKATFRATNLSWANLSGANLKQADLLHANLKQANLSHRS